MKNLQRKARMGAPTFATPAGDRFSIETIIAVTQSAVKRNRDGGETSEELLRLYCTQGEEMEALLNLQVERLRVDLAEIQRRNVEKMTIAVGLMLQEKEGRMERFRQENTALREGLRIVVVQNEHLQAAVKRGEAVVAGLTARHEMVQNEAETAAREREGIGDSEDVESGNGSGRSWDEEDKRLQCGVCREREVSVFLLPCRHICLCGECARVAVECPYCGQHKYATMQVLLPPAICPVKLK